MCHLLKILTIVALTPLCIGALNPKLGISGELEQYLLAEEVIRMTGEIEVMLEVAEMTTEAIMEAYDVSMKEQFGEQGQVMWLLVKKYFREELHAARDELGEDMALLYMKHFSEEELHDMIIFMRTPVGVKMQEKQENLGAEAQIIGERWGTEIADRAVKRALEQFE